MDCAAEEQLVRMHLSSIADVKRLAFDLSQRTVVVTHTGSNAVIERMMHELNLGASLVGHSQIDKMEPSIDDDRQRKSLIIVLLINATLFAVELATGIVANSMGLVADSLDMLADTLVYGMSLFAVGKALQHKKRVAQISGYFQLGLALFGLVEVVRRFLGAGDEPNFALMIGISLLALTGNVASLLVLQRAANHEVHMKASWIFTTNDVLVNIGVILAGVLVFMTGSKIPDLLVGAVVFCLVAYGAFRILKLSR
ncbi:MAG TPA: cation transporter [Chloroflexi bacterium]|jgi:cation diffusion facilitator family transporter|nr:cation transporter [Chloroflexota bacterium]HHW86580.1 cation transporter [Chloroflexota bacterium]